MSEYTAHGKIMKDAGMENKANCTNFVPITIFHFSNIFHGKIEKIKKFSGLCTLFNLSILYFSTKYKKFDTILRIIYSIY